MKKFISLSLLVSVFVFAGGDSKGIPSKSLTNNDKGKYAKQDDAKAGDAAKGENNQGETDKKKLAPAPEKQSSCLLSLFKCCCGKVEK